MTDAERIKKLEARTAELEWQLCVAKTILIKAHGDLEELTGAVEGVFRGGFAMPLGNGLLSVKGVDL